MSLHVDIHKSLGDFSLDVNVDAQTETLGFLGASGCGKSLTLRCVAGIETPDEGRIVVNDTVFFDSAAKVNLSPQQRKTALLFQNYMLFPNMTIEANVAAGIPKSVSKGERDAIVAAELKRFSLEGFNKRYPAGSSSAWHSRACSPHDPASSCSTSPSPHSIRTSRAYSNRTSSTSSRRSRVPSST